MRKVAVDPTIATGKQGQTKKRVEVENTAGFSEALLLCVGIASGGLASALWQNVLEAGIWGALIAVLIIILGYGMLLLAMSELLSIVPFTGGLYGYARCSMGPLMGYLTACNEMGVYMFYSVRTIQKIVKMLTAATSTDTVYEPIWALMVICLILLSQLQTDKLYWQIMIGCTIITFIVLALFFAGSVGMSSMNFGKNAFYGTSNGFDGTGDTFMAVLYLPMWFLMGIWSLPLAGSRVINAERNLPKALLSAYAIMSILGLTVLFIIASQYPGLGPELFRSVYALQYGLNHYGLGIPENFVSIMLLIPAYASATGFLFAAKHQLANMADSGMTFAFFKKRWGVNNIPINSVVFVTVLQYVLFLIINHYQHDDAATYRLCCIFACFLYMSMFCSFITFRSKFASMERHYTNPTGVVGACIGMLVFFFVLVSLFFYQPSDKNSLSLTWMAWMIIVTIYYFAYVQFTQFFSKEEQNKFIKAYILNANKRKKQSKWFKLMTQTIDYVTCGMPTRVSQIFSGTKGKKSMTKGAPSNQPSSRRAADLSMSKHAPLVAFNKVSVEPLAHIKDAMVSSKSHRNGLMRLSFGASKLAWSGKCLEDNESRKIFEILHELAVAAEEEDAPVESGNEEVFTAAIVVDGDDVVVDAVVAEILFEQFPDLFIPLQSDISAPTVDDIEMGSSIGTRSAEST